MREHFFLEICVFPWSNQILHQLSLMLMRSEAEKGCGAKELVMLHAFVFPTEPPQPSGTKFLK